MIYSAGLIPFRTNENNDVEFFLGHPGGNPQDVWYYLKGQLEEGEDPQTAAVREFKEESGLSMEDCQYMMLYPLGSVKQNPKKTVYAYGIYYPNIDPDKCHSNLCPDGVTPEIDKYRWMTLDEVKAKSHPKHLQFYEKLVEMHLSN